VKLRRSLIVAVVALVPLSACASTPGAKRIALDVVDTLDADPAVKECMRERIETYDEDELQDIAERANDGDATQLTTFENDLRACR
jgi:uncharacterized lipoprotein